MTRQPQPPPNAAASPGADTASINRQIATLLGWTQRYDSTSGCECWKDPANGYCDYVPDYAGDYGEALRLIETVCQRTHNGRKLWVEYMGIDSQCGEWAVKISLDTWKCARRHADTLPLAIAKAWIAAMLALKGDTDDGTN